MMENWVCARLTGGIGNRLFQLATAHKLSVDWSVPLIFAMPYCLPSEHGDYETIFKMFPGITKVWKAEPLLAIEQDWAFKYTPFPTIPLADKILLRGFWQAAEFVDTDKGLKPSWDSIDTETLLQRWNLTTTLQREKTAFLHVRLGDYTILPHHQVPLLPYYVKAMALFPEDTRFLVFSDEPEKVKTFPILDERCIIVKEDSELKSLYLMAKCHAGAITANSTFSWWGAAFGRQDAAFGRQDAAVGGGGGGSSSYRACMPSQWMGQCKESTNSIYPPWATVVSV